MTKKNGRTRGGKGTQVRHRLEAGRGTLCTSSCSNLKAKNELVKHETQKLKLNVSLAVLTLLGGVGVLLNNGSADLLHAITHLGVVAEGAGLYGMVAGGRRVFLSHSHKVPNFNQKEYAKYVDHVEHSGNRYFGIGAVVAAAGVATHVATHLANRMVLGGVDSLHGWQLPLPSFTDTTTLAYGLLGAGVAATTVAVDSKRKQKKLLAQD